MFKIAATFYSASLLLAVSGGVLAVEFENEPIGHTKKVKVEEQIIPVGALRRNSVLYETYKMINEQSQTASGLLQLPRDCIRVMCNFMDFESLVMFSQSGRFPFVLSYPLLHSEPLLSARNAYFFQLEFGEFDIGSQDTVDLPSFPLSENFEPSNEDTGYSALQLLLPIICKMEEAHAIVGVRRDKDETVKKFMSCWAYCFSTENIEFSNHMLKSSLLALKAALPLFGITRMPVREIMRLVVKLGKKYPERMGLLVHFITMYPNFKALSESNQSLIVNYAFSTFTVMEIDKEMVSSALSRIEPKEDAAIHFQDENFVMEVFEKLKEEKEFVAQFFK